MKKAELFILILNIIFLLLWIFGLFFAKILFVFSFLLLTLFYLILGFAYYNQISFSQLFKKGSYASLPKGAVISGILTGINYFIILICVLFQILLWPGSNAMAGSGVFFTLPILILFFYKLSKGQKTNSNSVRSLIMIGLMWLLFILPPSAKLSIFYHSYPNELKEAYLKYFKTLNVADWNLVIREMQKTETR